MSVVGEGAVVLVAVMSTVTTYTQSRSLYWTVLYTLHVLLNLATAGQFSLGWPWVDVITARALTGTGCMRTLDMSIV